MRYYLFADYAMGSRVFVGNFVCVSVHLSWTIYLSCGFDARKITNLLRGNSRAKQYSYAQFVARLDENL